MVRAVEQIMNPWSRRFSAYAKSQGRTEDEQWAFDGSGKQHTTWIREQWHVWQRESGRRSPFRQVDHDSFDKWLRARPIRNTPKTCGLCGRLDLVSDLEIRNADGTMVKMGAFCPSCEQRVVRVVCG